MLYDNNIQATTSTSTTSTTSSTSTTCKYKYAFPRIIVSCYMIAIFKQQHQHPLPARQQAHQQRVRISVFFCLLEKNHFILSQNITPATTSTSTSTTTTTTTSIAHTMITKVSVSFLLLAYFSNNDYDESSLM